MINKDIAGRKVIKAMSVGLAAVMATMSPMAALADTNGGTPNETPNYSDENHKSSTADEAREAVDTAEASATVVTGDVNANVNSGEVVVTNENTGATTDLSQAVKDAAGKIDNADNDNTSTSILDDLANADIELAEADVQLTIAEQLQQDWVNGEGTDVEYGDENKLPKNGYQKGHTETEGMNSEVDNANQANGEIETANAQIDVAVLDAGTANTDIEKAALEGNEALNNASKQVEAATSAASEATEIANQAEITNTEKVNAITNATSISQAQQAYGDLVAALAQAGSDIDTKKAAFNTAKTAYEGFEATYNDKVTALEIAQNNYDTAKSNYEDAMAAYEAADKKFDAAKEKYDAWKTRLEIVEKRISDFNTALQSAQAALKEAEADFELANGKVATLESAINAAKEAIIIEEGNADIVAKLDVIENDAKSNPAVKIEYAHQDDLFKSIITNYVLPNKNVIVDAGTSINVEVKKTNSTALSSDGNYFEVTYYVNGVLQKEYYNYVMSDSSKQGHNSMVIFQKRDNEVAASEAYRNANAGKSEITLYEQGLTEEQLDAYKVGDTRLEKADFNNAKETGEIVKVGDVWYQKGEAVPTITVSYNPQTGLVSNEYSEDGKTRTEVIVDTKTVNGEYVIDEATGELKQKFTGDVTTLVYTQNSLNVNPEDGAKVYADKAVAETQIAADGVFTSKEAAQAALEQAKEGLDVINSEITEGEYTYNYTESVEKEKTTYQASGSYVPMFTDVIDVNDKYTRDTFLSYIGDGFGQNENDSINKIESAYSGYEIVSKNYKLNSEYSGNNYVGFLDWEYYYSVTGTATVTYVSKEYCGEADPEQFLLQDFYSWVGKIFGGNMPTDAEIKQKMETELASQGIVIYDWEKFDWKLGRGTVKYYKSVTVSGEAKDSKKDADASLTTALNTAISNSTLKTSAASNKTTTLVTDFKDYKGNVVNTKKQNDTYTEGKAKYYEDAVKEAVIKTYGYSVNYWEQTDSSTKQVILETNAYADAQKVYGVVDQNKNYADKIDNLVVAEDEGLQAQISKTREAQALLAKYTRLSEEAAAAKQQVETSKQIVDELKAKLGENYNDAEKAYRSVGNQLLPNAPTSKTAAEWIDEFAKTNSTIADKNTATIAALKEFFAKYGVEENDEITLFDIADIMGRAETDIKEAEQKVKDLIENLSNVEDQLNKKISDLTPADNDGGYTGGDTSDEGGTTVVLPTVRPIPSGTETIATLTTAEEDPNAEVLGARRNTRSASKKAATGLENNVGGEGEEIVGGSDVIVEKEKAPKVDKEKETVTIEDGDVALAGSLTDEEKQGMSWWWLLIIAVLGTTGEELYRRNRKKATQKASDKVTK